MKNLMMQSFICLLQFFEFISVNHWMVSAIILFVGGCVTKNEVLFAFAMSFIARHHTEKNEHSIMKLTYKVDELEFKIKSHNRV